MTTNLDVQALVTFDQLALLGPFLLEFSAGSIHRFLANILGYQPPSASLLKLFDQNSKPPTEEMLGSLRLILAIAVLLAHLAGCTYVMTGGGTSVQSFYVISGFFMAMILDVKYARTDQTGLFYSNRFLRIYSVYWLFLLASLFVHMIAALTAHTGVIEAWLQYYPRMGWSGAGFLAVANVAIFMQDWTLFLALGDHGLHWTSNFLNGSPILPVFLLVPPAWSLGVELSFYLIAPWILRRRTAAIVVLLIGSLSLRYVLWRHGLRADPWSVRFFPSEIATFLLGALSYRLIYRRIKERRLAIHWRLIGFGILPAIMLYPLYDHSDGLFFAPTQLLFYSYLAIAVPILFRTTGKNRFDHQLGELSYPFYLCHMLVLGVMGRYASHLGGVVMRAILAVVISSAAAYLVVIFFDAPINRFRQHRVERNNELHGIDSSC